MQPLWSLLQAEWGKPKVCSFLHKLISRVSNGVPLVIVASVKYMAFSNFKVFWLIR